MTSEKHVHFRGQAGQDLWVYKIAVQGEGQTKGTFLDVGANDPVFHNNTFALEEVGWRGLLVDRDPRWNNPVRQSPYLCCDAKSVDWLAEIDKHGLPHTIDYLSFDLDEDGLAVLAKFPLASVRFRLLTVEHDAYRFGDSVREEMRGILRGYGYELLCPDVMADNHLPFEDWWVDPLRVDMTVANRFRTSGPTSFREIVNR